VTQFGRKTQFRNSIKQNASKYAVLTLFVVLLMPSFANTNSYATDDCNTSVTTRVDQLYQGPVFIRSYWTESHAALNANTSDQVEREVGPGEGRATLALVLLNRSVQDISAVTAYMRLPEGFKAVGTSIYPQIDTIAGGNGKGTGFNAPATASYNSIIPARTAFTLYFDVEVTDKATVGTKMTQIIGQYYLPAGLSLCTSAMFTVPIVLSGKTILDISSNDDRLIPKIPNPVNITIMNKGTANATGVVASIINLGDSGSTGRSDSSSSVVLQSSQTKLINLGQNTFNIGTIPANSSATISTVIFPSKDAAGTVQNIDILLSYGNAYGNIQTTTMRTGLVVLPNPTGAELGITYDSTEDSHLLTAGSLQDLNFTIANNDQSPLSNIVISIAPQSTSVTIVSDSKWTISALEPGETKRITTKVVAAKSMINTPTSFTLTANYIADEEEKTDALNLGAFVTGDITIQVYDLAVNYVGNTPNIVGSVLNQGNTVAHYASIQMLPTENAHASESKDPQKLGRESHVGNGTDSEPILSPQYIGDISEDSSIPFNIPLAQNALKPGINPVSLKITYADDLKKFHEVTVKGQVNFDAKPNFADAGRRGDSQFGTMQYPVIIIVAAAIATSGIAVKKYKKSKNGKSKTVDHAKTENDMDALLDEYTKKQDTKNNEK